jgi:hypothetical protein
VPIFMQKDVPAPGSVLERASARAPAVNVGAADGGGVVVLQG